MKLSVEEQNRVFREKIKEYGMDIVESHGMHRGKGFRHHGDINVYRHTMSVVCTSLAIVQKMHLKVDERSMVRGALLHDYYLYDWHDKESWHDWHGFVHAGFALKNAMRDFGVNRIEADIIARHMFPLNIRPPKYKESWVVCLADKISAFRDYSPFVHK